MDWIATNNPRMGGLCPGEVGLGILLIFTVVVFLLAQLTVRESVFVFLYYFSVPIAALATAGAALETWRNLRQIERTDEGAMTPHLWLLGVQQNRLAVANRGTPTSVTGLHELFLHNYGPGLAVDVRISIDAKLIDRIPYVDPGATAQVGGAFHGHGLEGSHVLEVVYEASSGREHRLMGTLFRDRDMEEILFRSEQFNHVYSVA